MTPPQRNVPMWRQLYDHLVNEINAGRLHPGGPVPSEAKLGAAHGVSRATTTKALLALQQDGYVVRTAGRTGTRVADNPPRTDPPQPVAHGDGGAAARMAVDLLRDALAVPDLTRAELQVLAEALWMHVDTGSRPVAAALLVAGLDITDVRQALQRLAAWNFTGLVTDL